MPSILLVDDDAAVLDLLTRFFEKRGWLVHATTTGTGALRTYEAERPDLVLLDLELPDLNGIPVLRRLRDLDEDVTVIMLTGHADIETAVEAMRLGAENFLTKPFELDHLAAVVERAKEKAELRRHNRVNGHRSCGRHSRRIPGFAAGAGSLGCRPRFRTPRASGRSDWGTGGVGDR